MSPGTNLSVIAQSSLARAPQPVRPAGKSLRTVFISPTGAVVSGTVDYFHAFLQELAADLRPASSLIVADTSWPGMEGVTEQDGIAVVDYRAYVPAPTDLVFLFLANNEHHLFAFQFLRMARPVARLIVILHDVQILMNVLSLSLRSLYGFAPESLASFIEDEWGPLTPAFIEQFKMNCMPDQFRYTTLAQGLSLRAASEVWVHSYYGAVKLLLDQRDPRAAPPIRVIEHTDVAFPSAVDSSSRLSRFNVGVFGWVTPMKRVNEIIKAFGAWWPRLPQADRDRVRLLVAGHLPPPEYYDPISCARNAGVSEAVVFRGYLELDEFERALASCSLVFNLRFPSCGETSGILHRLRDMRIPVVTSAYASFHEEPADFRCSVHPDREQADIVQILEDSWAAWKVLGSTASLVKARPPVTPKTKVADAFRKQCEQMKERGYTYE